MASDEAKIREGVNGLIERSPVSEDGIRAALHTVISEVGKACPQISTDAILRVALAWVSKEICNPNPVAANTNAQALDAHQPPLPPSWSFGSFVGHGAPASNPTDVSRATFAPVQESPSGFTPRSNFSSVPVAPQAPVTPTKRGGGNVQFGSPASQASPGSIRVNDTIQRLFPSPQK